MKVASSKTNSKIAVSGVGIVSPLGLNAETTWANLIAGKTGVKSRVIAREDVIARPRRGRSNLINVGIASLPSVARNDTRLEARVAEFSPNGARSRMGDFAIMAAAEALRQAGFKEEDVKGRPFGCAVSQSKPVLAPKWNCWKTAVIPECLNRESTPSDGKFTDWIPAFVPSKLWDVPSIIRLLKRDAGMTSRFIMEIMTGQSRFYNFYYRRDRSVTRSQRLDGTGFATSSEMDEGPLEPALVLASFSGWSAESVVKREFGLTGPSQNVVAACATGIAAIQTGMHWIWEKKCTVVLAGASESSIHPLYIAGFENMGALCPGRFPTDVKPFDRNRSGFAMGEGAAVLVLEDFEALLARGGKPLAILINAQMMQNPSDLIRFDEDGGHVGRLIRVAVGDLDRVGYINAHGTATKINDLQETRGIKRAFGKRAGRIPVSSTKAATGHLLGAAGALEAALAVLALRDQIIPPTLHLTEPDPECDLDYVPHVSRKAQIETALSLSYGFGGQMGAVLFARA